MCALHAAAVREYLIITTSRDNAAALVRQCSLTL